MCKQLKKVLTSVQIYAIIVLEINPLHLLNFESEI